MIKNEAMFATDEKKKEKNKLTDKESRELVQKYRETGNEIYKEEFFEKNKRFAHHIARQYQNTRIDYDDLVSFAYYGMLKAFRTYNLDKDVRFTSYSARCMHNEILMEIRRMEKLKRNTSLEGTLSTDVDGNELTVMDILESDTSNDYDRLLMSESLVELFEQLKNELDERGQFILSNMLSEDRLGQREVAEKFELSQSYISRLEKVIVTRAKELMTEMGMENLFKFNTSYEKKQSQVLPKPEQMVDESPVITYTLKEPVNMEKKPTIEVPEGTLKEKVAYLMDTHPLMTAKEIAQLLNKTTQSIYTYTHTIKKEREKMQSTVKAEKKPVEVPVTVTTSTNPPPPPVYKEAKKSPQTLELSLSGVEGDQLQRLIVELVLNGIAKGDTFNFAVSLEKVGE